MVSNVQGVVLVDRKAVHAHAHGTEVHELAPTTEDMVDVGFTPATEELQVILSVPVPDGPLGKRKSASPVSTQSHIGYGAYESVLPRKVWHINVAIGATLSMLFASGAVTLYLIQEFI